MARDKRLSMQVDSSLYIEKKTFYTPRKYQEFVKGYLEFLGKLVVKLLRRSINRQRYRWQPLSPAYRDWKKAMKLDLRIWIASGEVRNSIKCWHSRLYNSFIVGVNPRKLHHVYKEGGIYKSKKTKVLLIDIIRFMEFGTRNMPPRPLFAPVFREIEKNQGKYFQQYLKKAKT